MFEWKQLEEAQEKQASRKKHEHCHREGRTKSLDRIPVYRSPLLLGPEPEPVSRQDERGYWLGQK